MKSKLYSSCFRHHELLVLLETPAPKEAHKRLVSVGDGCSGTYKAARKLATWGLVELGRCEIMITTARTHGQIIDGTWTEVPIKRYCRYMTVRRTDFGEIAAQILRENIERGTPFKWSTYAAQLDPAYVALRENHL